MNRIALLAALWGCTGMGAIACELPGDGHRLSSRDGAVVLSFRPDPGGFAVDRQFSLIVHACSRTPITTLSVDAHMPEHRHAMNYKASVTPTAPGVWRADGLLLHMPGKWEFIFAARIDGVTERLTHVVRVQ